MDDADRASEREEQLKAQALAHREPEGPKATGYCLACGDELVVTTGRPGTERTYNGRTLYGVIDMRVDLDRRWCDAQCRDDWEKRND